MIGIVIPSRGMVFTEVILAVEKIRTSTWHKTKLYLSHDKPIPDSFNDLTEQALSDGMSAIWYVEEDTVPTSHALDKLMGSSADISFIDYGVNGWSCSARNKQTENILWCGLGCTLVHRRVFNRMVKPYFRTDKKLRLNDNQWISTTHKDVYGNQDIWFFSQARKAGFTFEQIHGECRHLKLDEVGRDRKNNGLHTIGLKTAIERQQYVEFEE